MAENLDALSAAVEFLPLPTGLYVFSVRSAARAQRVGAQRELALPALQIGTGPGAAADQVEFMTGPLTHSAWLCEPHDQIVIKVKAQSATLLLTSIVAPGMTPLEIGVQRLDRTGGQVVEADSDHVTGAVPQPLQTTLQSIRLKVTPHIQNTGDIAFADSQWAGLVDERVWIESFSILPMEELSPEQIEYKAVTATGVETPWVSNGGLCGTRGIMVPLVGFAVRLKSQSGTAHGSEYGAVLLSGKVIGPFRDGAMCQSSDMADPIGAIWVSIGRSDLARNLNSNDAQPSTMADPKFITGSQADQSEDAAIAKRRRSPVGPRFSVFREAPETDQE